MPPAVIGYLLLPTFKQEKPIGGFLEEAFWIFVAFKCIGAVQAAVIMAFPLIVRSMRLTADNVDANL